MNTHFTDLSNFVKMAYNRDINDIIKNIKTTNKIHQEKFMKESYEKSYALWSENKFKELFIDSLNWDNPTRINSAFTVEIENEQNEEKYLFSVTPIAGKRGVDVMDIYCESHDNISTSVVRKLSKKLKFDIIHENLLLITEKSKEKEIWFHEGSGDENAISMTVDPIKQSKSDLGMLFLSQLYYEFKDEENLTITDVSNKVQSTMKSLGNYPATNSFAAKLGDITVKNDSLYLNKIKLADFEFNKTGGYEIKFDKMPKMELKTNDKDEIISKIVWAISNNKEIKEKLKEIQSNDAQKSIGY